MDWVGQRGKKSALARVLILLVCLVCAACESATIIEDRNQREAIEIVALLHSYGISATTQRESGGRGRYVVQVDKAARSQALTILWEKGYPKESEKTFEELVAPHGLIPNSRAEESLRLDRAMAIELEDMLRAHPGVASARAIVRLNYIRDSQEAKLASPSVSVVVQQKTGIDLKAEQLAEIIQRAIPGVVREQVSISLQPENVGFTVAWQEGATMEKGKVIRRNLVPFLYFYYVAEDSYGKLALTLVGCLVAVLLVGIIGGYWYGYFQTSKSFFESESGELPMAALRYERPKKDLPGV